MKEEEKVHCDMSINKNVSSPYFREGDLVREVSYSSSIMNDNLYFGNNIN